MTRDFFFFTPFRFFFQVFTKVFFRAPCPTHRVASVSTLPSKSPTCCGLHLLGGPRRYSAGKQWFRDPYTPAFTCTPGKRW